MEQESANSGHVLADADDISEKLESFDDEPELAPKSEESGQKTVIDPNNFPDGGFEAWLVVAGGFCTVFSSFGWINCKCPATDYRMAVYADDHSGIGVFQNYYQENQLKSYSPSTIAWIPSTEAFMLFFWVC
jgi:hypothetical protein